MLNVFIALSDKVLASKENGVNVFLQFFLSSVSFYFLKSAYFDFAGAC